MPRLTFLLALLLVITPHALAQHKPVGVQGKVGCNEKPRKVERLVITKPGVYENYLVDSNWDGGNRVKISADNVILRNCEIRNATGNGVGVSLANFRAR